MAGVETVLDAGPIPYEQILLYGDPDLEHGLRHVGLEPAETFFRLIEIPLDTIRDVRTMPWPNRGHAYADLLREGTEFPPIVVMRIETGWTLIDGVNRSHAYLALGWKTVRAYELIEASHAIL